VALLSVLLALAKDDLAAETADLYEGLLRNDDGYWTDVLLAGGRVWQPGAGEPYRADVAFDVLDDDPLVARCAEPGWPGASRIRELGDGRLLGAARRVDVTDRLLAPALAASVRGLAARAWLDAARLDAIGRLGVAALRWHVAPADRPAALAHAAPLARPGRPAVEVVDEGAAARFLEVAGPPAPPASPSLEAALDALTARSWRARVAGRPLADLLSDLSGWGSVDPVLGPDARASILVLRQRGESALEAASLDLEAAFLDGREPAGGS
jgi:hypothetical protein